MYHTIEDLRGEYRHIIMQEQQQTEKSFAVDIRAIAKNCDVPIQYVDFPSVDQNGELCRLNNGRYVIRISEDIRPNTYRNRRRYTIAHEIAHYMLHGHLLNPGDRLERGLRDGWDDSRETEANRLAADILMPNFLIREIINTLQGKSITAGYVADTLRVSEAALRIKLGMPKKPSNKKFKK